MYNKNIFKLQRIFFLGHRGERRPPPQHPRLLYATDLLRSAKTIIQVAKGINISLYV